MASGLLTSPEGATLRRRPSSSTSTCRTDSKAPPLDSALYQTTRQIPPPPPTGRWLDAGSDSPLASAVAVWSPLVTPLLLILVNLALLWLLLGEWRDDCLWLRKTPGAMGLGPSGALTVSALKA